MKTLRETILEAQAGHYAIGHFNVSDSNQSNAVIAAALETGLPVIIGASEGERTFIGARNLAALVRSAQADNKQVYLNADHTYTVEGVKEVIDLGYDAVIFDGSHLPMEENIAKTKEIVEYARASGRDVLVEAEIGRIGTSSKLLDAPPADMDTNLTTVEEALHFLQSTGVDMLAPAVGTMHGRLKGGGEPKIDLERIRAIASAIGIPLVLHGGSGSSESDLQGAGRAGCAIVHINTDIRIAYRQGIEHALSQNADEIAPYKFMAEGYAGVRDVTARYLKLFAKQD
jgi:fructose-bisphosphate aldolase class II